MVEIAEATCKVAVVCVMIMLQLNLKNIRVGVMHLLSSAFHYDQEPWSGVPMHNTNGAQNYFPCTHARSHQ